MLHRLSLRLRWDSDTAFPGADALVVGGYDQIARVLAQDLTIKLREAVQRITYASGKGVTVTTQNGLYRAKHAIVTLPLGVLKAKTVSFGPPLPARVQVSSFCVCHIASVASAGQHC